MPNIEIHGYGAIIPDLDMLETIFHKDICPVFIKREAFSAKIAIKDVLKGIGLEKSAIITIFPSIARSCNDENEEAPFIRISNTKPEETNRIINALKKAQLLTDVETMTLTGFIPGDEMA